MHPADRAALAAAIRLVIAVVAMAAIVWHTFNDRWLNAVFAVAAGVAFIATGWVARRWFDLADHDDPDDGQGSR